MKINYIPKMGNYYTTKNMYKKPKRHDDTGDAFQNLLDKIKTMSSEELYKKRKQISNDLKIKYNL